MSATFNCPRITILAVAAALLSWCNAGNCQDNGPLTRKEVRAQTLAALRAHMLVPAGEGSFIAEPPSSGSTKTGAQVRQETLRARDLGELRPAGEAGSWKAEREATNIRSTRTRAQVEAETIQAARDHKLIAAGEGIVSQWSR